MCEEASFLSKGYPHHVLMPTPISIVRGIGSASSVRDRGSSACGGGCEATQSSSGCG